MQLHLIIMHQTEARYPPTGCPARAYRA